jgi:hypothetical protein
MPVYSPNLTLNVATFRSAGLEARWTKTRSGTPCMVTRNPTAKLKHQRETWWIVDRGMWETAQKIGIVEAFDRHTLLGNFFAI